MKQKPIELGEVKESTITVGDFNTTFSERNRSSRRKIRKDLAELDNTINQLDIIDIHRLLHPTAEYTFFLSSYVTFTKDRP